MIFLEAVHHAMMDGIYIGLASGANVVNALQIVQIAAIIALAVNVAQVMD